MITKAQVNHIQLLSDKKYRSEFSQYVIEGDKMIQEALSANVKIIQLLATSDWLARHTFLTTKNIDIISLKLSELPRISQFKTPQEVIAIIEYKQEEPLKPDGVNLILDGIQDPGNMGSLIRIADWYGISTIYCSDKCADRYNTKVLQSSMGSIFRVSIHYVDLVELLKTNKTSISYAATLHGEPLSSIGKLSTGFIILGNESKGVSAELLSLCNHQLTIPRKGRAESLNVAVAGGIICHSLLS